jgi:hypothetical protein
VVLIGVGVDFHHYNQDDRLEDWGGHAPLTTLGSRTA